MRRWLARLLRRIANLLDPHPVLGRFVVEDIAGVVLYRGDLGAKARQLFESGPIGVTIRDRGELRGIKG